MECVGIDNRQQEMLKAFNATSREAVYTFLLPYKELDAIYYYVLDIIFTFDFAALASISN
jgi:hypothetical protein